MFGKGFEIRSADGDDMSHVSFAVRGVHKRAAHCGAAVRWDARTANKPLCPTCAAARDEALRTPWWRQVTWREVLALDTPDPGESRFKHFWFTWFARSVVAVGIPLIIILTLVGILLLIDLLVFGFQITPQLLWHYWLSDEKHP